MVSRKEPVISVDGMHCRRSTVVLEDADAMLIVGSSLMVYSGFRFVQSAPSAGKPAAAVNLGQTRADALLALKLEERCDAALAFRLGEPETLAV